MKKYDDGLGLTYRYLNACSVIARQFLNAEQANDYSDRAMTVLYTCAKRRSFVLCRTRRPVPPVIETPTGRPAVTHSTEVRPLSSFDAFSLSESGPHGPPCLVGGPP